LKNLIFTHCSGECSGGTCVYIILCLQVSVAGKNYTIGKVKFFTSHVASPVKVDPPSTGMHSSETNFWVNYVNDAKINMKPKFQLLLSLA